MKRYFLFIQLSLILFLFILCTIPGFVIAQSAPIIKGQMVRVTTKLPYSYRLEGTFAGMQNDSLKLNSNGKNHIVPGVQIAKVEVAKGFRTNVLKGAGIGALLGGLGLGIVAAVDVSNESSIGGPSSGQALVGGLVVGSLAGGGIGALVGMAIISPKWQEVEIQEIK